MLRFDGLPAVAQQALCHRLLKADVVGAYDLVDAICSICLSLVVPIDFDEFTFRHSKSQASSRTACDSCGRNLTDATFVSILFA